VRFHHCRGTEIMSLLNQTATQLLARLEAREITAVELTTAFLNQIQSHDARVQAFLRTMADSALAKAKDVDARRAAGKPIGKLGGLPVAVKDVLCTQGEVTTCASKMLQNFVPPYNATVVEKLLAADAVLIGKTNMDEFAM